MSAPQLKSRMSVKEYLSMLPSLQATQAEGCPAGRTKRRETPEEDLQIACFSWVALMVPMHPILKWMVHVPNGGKRTKAEAGRLKAMGVKSGVLDVLLPRRHQGWQGLAIELKSATGRLSADQEAWLAAFDEDGYHTAVCRTIDEFMAAVNTFLAGRDVGCKGARNEQG